MRHQEWNYAGSGWYYVTICTHERRPFFGDVDGEGVMNLNTLGRMVEEEWCRTPEIRPYVKLDEYSIMPDHVHGIMALYREGVGPEILAKKDHWQSGCLGAIIGRFKAQCAKRIRRTGCSSFEWQRNFHDHVIRNEKDLDRIRSYVRSNPEADAFGRGL
jgi:putative transposase